MPEYKRQKRKKKEGRKVSVVEVYTKYESKSEVQNEQGKKGVQRRRNEGTAGSRSEERSEVECEIKGVEEVIRANR